MTNEMKRNEDFDSGNLIIFFYKWRKPLIIVVIVAALGSWFFSCPWFITPKFQSAVIMYPASSSSVSRALLSDQSAKGQDLVSFGEDEQAEQLLQILSSNKIRDRIIQKFNLVKHYRIDSSSRYKNESLYKEYDKNIAFRRTEYMAVQISVLDKDPQMAADIANKIADLLDSAKNQMQRQRAYSGYKIVETEYNSLKKEVDNIADSLVAIGKLGVNDVEYQSQALNTQMAIATSNNNRSAMAALQKRLDVLGKYGGIYMSLKNALEFKTHELTLLQAKFKEAKVDAEEDLPQKFIVNNGYKAERKSYPVQWLIMLVSTFSALFFTVIVIIIMEKISSYESHKKFHLS
jgi:uncharacterized protein involved in exopolysaccharide biosynthesis